VPALLQLLGSTPHTMMFTSPQKTLPGCKTRKVGVEVAVLLLHRGSGAAVSREAVVTTGREGICSGRARTATRTQLGKVVVIVTKTGCAYRAAWGR
jgi:hypothetical protein